MQLSSYLVRKVGQGELGVCGSLFDAACYVPRESAYSMMPTRSILVFGLVAMLISAGAATSLGWQDAPSSAPPASEKKGDEAGGGGGSGGDAGSGGGGGAVILEVNRNTVVRGHVELEDEDVIVVRTEFGKVESFPKSRILRIVRLVEPEPGQRGIVYMRSGRAREGIIHEDTFDHVTIEIEGIKAKLRRELVDHVVLKPTMQQRYQQFKATLGPRMYDRHLMLCQWLVDERQWDLAKQELDELLESADQPLPEAHRLRRLVDAQLALRTSAKQNEEDGEQPQEEELDPELGRILSREEVNLMRVYEIDFHAPPRVVVKPETIRKMIEQYGSNEVIPATQAERSALFRADPLEIVWMLFTLRARDLYGEVQVLSEPPALNLFRRRVHDGWLIQNCATGACHGGADAGRFILHRRSHNDERVRYTNLLILERLELDPDYPLINYNEPEMSLLIQHALPRDVARLPHPDVRGWRPVFRRANDRKKQNTIRWIESMMQPRPEYPIEFEPPQPDADDDERASGDRVPR